MLSSAMWMTGRDRMRCLEAAHVLFLDGTYNLTFVDMVVMLAHVLDSNNRVRPVAYGVFGVENGAAQRFFLEGLCSMVPGLEHTAETVFTDGRFSEEHVSAVFPTAQHCRCCLLLPPAAETSSYLSRRSIIKRN